MTIIILLVFVLIIFIIYLYMFNNDVKYYDYGNMNAQYKICIIAGVHGNEPAASILLNKMINTNYFNQNINNLFIRVIPIANKFGSQFNTRYQNNIFFPDINRNFINDDTDNLLFSDTSKDIIKLTKNMDLVLDFHEGWGFHKINSDSLGSTITITPKMKDLGNIIINNLNNIISNEQYKFVILENICDINSTLGCYSNNNNNNYILVETTGQNDIQKMKIRHDQIFNIINTVINYYTT